MTLGTYMKKVGMTVCTSSHRSARAEAGGSLALLASQSSLFSRFSERDSVSKAKVEIHEGQLMLTSGFHMRTHVHVHTYITHIHTASMHIHTYNVTK